MAIAAEDIQDQANHLEVLITDVRSYGNLFIGHYKSVDIEVSQYTNHQLTAQTKISRRSTGGFFGGLSKARVRYWTAPPIP